MPATITKAIDVKEGDIVHYSGQKYAVDHTTNSKIDGVWLYCNNDTASIHLDTNSLVAVERG